LPDESSARLNPRWAISPTAMNAAHRLHKLHGFARYFDYGEGSGPHPSTGAKTASDWLAGAYRARRAIGILCEASRPLAQGMAGFANCLRSRAQAMGGRVTWRRPSNGRRRPSVSGNSDPRVLRQFATVENSINPEESRAAVATHLAVFRRSGGPPRTLFWPPWAVHDFTYAFGSVHRPGQTRSG